MRSVWVRPSWLMLCCEQSLPFKSFLCLQETRDASLNGRKCYCAAPVSVCVCVCARVHPCVWVCTSLLTHLWCCMHKKSERTRSGINIFFLKKALQVCWGVKGHQVFSPRHVLCSGHSYSGGGGPAEPEQTNTAAVKSNCVKGAALTGDSSSCQMVCRRLLLFWALTKTHRNLPGEKCWFEISSFLKPCQPSCTCSLQLHVLHQKQVSPRNQALNSLPIPQHFQNKNKNSK